MSLEQSNSAIQLRVDKVSQLFNTLDPFPFRERDLDKDAEEFIVGWARELPKNLPIRIVVHVPGAAGPDITVNELGAAMSRYFSYRAEIVGLDLNELFRLGRRYLIIGLVVLAACLAAGRAIAGFGGTGQPGRIIQEGLVILGWVANWKPLEIFLYEWWPIAQRKRLYARLAHATVTLQAENGVSPTP